MIDVTLGVVLIESVFSIGDIVVIPVREMERGRASEKMDLSFFNNNEDISTVISLVRFRIESSRKDNEY